MAHKTWDLIKCCPGSDVLGIAHFDPEDVPPFKTGRDPFVLFRDVDSVSEDEDPQKQTSVTRRWTMYGTPQNEGDKRTIYHGKPRPVQDRASAYVLISTSRQDPSKMHVIPITGEMVDYHRVASVADGPRTTVREAETLMKQRRCRVRDISDDDDVASSSISKRQRMERLLLRSLKRMDDSHKVSRPVQPVPLVEMEEHEDEDVIIDTGYPMDDIMVDSESDEEDVKLPATDQSAKSSTSTPAPQSPRALPASPPPAEAITSPLPSASLSSAIMSRVRERLVGLGGKVRSRDLMPFLKDLMSNRQQVAELRNVLAHLTTRETDPSDGQVIFTIRPAFL